MYKTVVTEIGESAINEKDPLVILFGEKATSQLRKVSVVHSPEKQNEVIDLTKVTKIVFGTEEYTVKGIGELANDNFNTIGHITLRFSDNLSTEDMRIENAVYLSPEHVPTLKKGTEITFK